jgi:hypothetical protein
MIKSSHIAAVVIAFSCSLHAYPAQAQRVFVSATGSDSNPCSFASPCRSFQHAHDTAPAGGEIDVLDPAGYGPLTITKPISIQGHGFSGISVASGATGITINASSTAAVSLNGLLIEGGGVGGTGIVFNTGQSLAIENCVIRNLIAGGVDFIPTVSSALAVSNTFIADSGAYAGILVGPHANSLAIVAALNRVELHNNFRGLYIYDFGYSGGTIDVSAMDTVASNNATSGFEVNTTALSSPVVHVSLVRVAAVNNGSVGVYPSGPQSTVRLAQSLVTGNFSGWISQNGSLLYSYGNNQIDGNANSESAPLYTGPK